MKNSDLTILMADFVIYWIQAARSLGNIPDVASGEALVTALAKPYKKFPHPTGPTTSITAIPTFH